MTQLKLIVNSMPRDLAEFMFFLIVGFTAGTLGVVWLKKLYLLIKSTHIYICYSYWNDSFYWEIQFRSSIKLEQFYNN